MKHKRHWSFIVTDMKYLYSFVIVIVLIGCSLSYLLKEPSQFSRVGNLIIGLGVWMSMRYTFRDGIERNKNALDDSPTLPGPGHMRQLNPNYFNKISFQLGDAILQIHGFILVIIGSIIGSYGDLIFRLIFN